MTVDASGFRPTRASQQYLSRCGRLMRDYVKGFCAVATKQQYILARRYARGPSGSDAPYRACTRRRVTRFLKPVNPLAAWVLVGD